DLQRRLDQRHPGPRRATGRGARLRLAARRPHVLQQSQGEAATSPAAPGAGSEEAPGAGDGAAAYRQPGLPANLCGARAAALRHEPGRGGLLTELAGQVQLRGRDQEVKSRHASPAVTVSRPDGDRGGSCADRRHEREAIMIRYAAGRVLAMVPVLFGVSIVVFLLIRLIPGNPAVSILGERATPELVERVKNQLGLDLPIWRQYLHFLGNAS